MRFENEFVGLSIKEILTSQLGFSKRAITALKARPDGILLNGEHATVRALIRENDILEINIDDTIDNKEKLVPSTVLPNIIYEDEDLVVLNKPPHMPTHQSQGHFYDTLANALAYYYSIQKRPFVFRSINRLDKNTSGTVLVAKNKICASKLSAQMKADGIKKTYLAILNGYLPENEGRITTYIKRKEKSIILRQVCDECEDSKIAMTDYKVIAKGNGLSLVEATPVTGRTHQLRVHFAYLGAQILGDDLYGYASPLINRHALHSYSLSFTHPINEKELRINAPLPDDMAKVIEENFGKDILNLWTKK